MGACVGEAADGCASGSPSAAAWLSGAGAAAERFSPKTAEKPLSSRARSCSETLYGRVLRQGNDKPGELTSSAGELTTISVLRVCE